MDIKEKVFEIIGNVMTLKTIGTGESLRELGINSVQFVQIIVKLEAEIGIEFPDEMLIFNEATSINDLINNVEKVYQAST
jgi:acyl carrier protein